MPVLAGIDIGGTKCAVLLGDERGNIHNKIKIETTTYEDTLARILEVTENIFPFDAIGISCGGPLDSREGIIKSPPNLPGWYNVPICKIFRNKFHVPVRLSNDADACAVAEWKFGAGRGYNNIIFLTFGTGMGAGLILNGKLYSGTCDMAGEIGHIRLSPFGPVGYGKAGSFEGFCSGGGIAQIGTMLREEQRQAGEIHISEEKLSARGLAKEARLGNELAKKAYRIAGEKLGQGLSVLIDILNPQRIIIGSIFSRAQDLLWESARAVIEKETLAASRKACQIVPAELGESIGDIAALVMAKEAWEENT